MHKYINDKGNIQMKEEREEKAEGYATTTPTNHLLSTALQAAIPLWIQILMDHGSIVESGMNECKRLSSLLGEKGDILLYGGGKKGECANLFNRTAKAILSFVPGGTTVFGLHWESSFDNSGGSCLVLWQR